MEIPKIILKPTINAICRIESMFWPIIIGIILIVSFFIQEIYHLAYITIILFVYKTCVEISKSKKTVYAVTKDSIYFGTDSKPDTNPLFIKDIKELWLKQSFFKESSTWAQL